MLLVPKVPVLLVVLYHRLDYPSLLQQFEWSLEDELPKLPRVTRFIDHWRSHIGTPINSIFLEAGSEVRVKGFRHVDELYRLN